jgi:hypothetical protein
MNRTRLLICILTTGVWGTHVLPSHAICMSPEDFLKAANTFKSDKESNYKEIDKPESKSQIGARFIRDLVGSYLGNAPPQELQSKTEADVITYAAQSSQLQAASAKEAWTLLESASEEEAKAKFEMVKALVGRGELVLVLFHPTGKQALIALALPASSTASATDPLNLMYLAPDGESTPSNIVKTSSWQDAFPDAKEQEVKFFWYRY